ncbi:MAG: SDR family NAD(P)-dependent oxidoreductase [Candidatus Andeanibacterium colombiense]|uniref:SDR family NAD(P)-dependent oxidoreductase n=1 Tax=Candidatus Andeanibacterium colombiense TaxID=3121345 RepID=A0AAJ6BPE9_9SPHN|nr:MAG: SDR family NAD(P)-dependent oxidoreductase [Sphingomonadaceae bacterium]
MLNRRVVITGGLGALGGAAEAAFVARGDRVVLIDVAPQMPGGRSPDEVIVDVDLADMTRAQYALARASAQLGGIDVLVNTAGGYAWERAAPESFLTLQRMWLANVATCFNACVAALSHMSDGGRIVNVGAMSAGRGTEGHASYAAAKSAVARLTEALAEEAAGRNIGVNAVLPGIIDTPANRAAMPEADHAAWTAPAAIAEVIEFLASPRARAISGALVPVTAACDE